MGAVAAVRDHLAAALAPAGVTVHRSGEGASMAAPFVALILASHDVSGFRNTEVGMEVVCGVPAAGGVRALDDLVDTVTGLLLAADMVELEASGAHDYDDTAGVLTHSKPVTILWCQP